MEARLAKLDYGPDPFVVAPRDVAKAKASWLRQLIETPLALLFATLCATSATASFMAYHFHDSAPMC